MASIPGKTAKLHMLFNETATVLNPLHGHLAAHRLVCCLFGCFVNLEVAGVDEHQISSSV